MPKLPQVKSKNLEKALLKLGFLARTTKSSHVVFTHADGRRTVVPVHNRPVSTGTLRSILRQAKISVEEFLKLI